MSITKNYIFDRPEQKFMSRLQVKLQSTELATATMVVTEKIVLSNPERVRKMDTELSSSYHLPMILHTMGLVKMRVPTNQHSSKIFIISLIAL